MRLVICAAFPQEVKKIITRLKAEKDAKQRPFDVYRVTRLSTEIILVITGIGTANAESAARYVHAEFDPHLILSIGYGGAVYEGATVGDLLWGSKFLLMPEPTEEETRNSAESRHLEIQGNKKILAKLQGMILIREGTIVTLPSLMKKSEIRKAISGEMPNLVCDMETFALAHFCAETGLRFAAVRSITDLHDEDIPPELGDISDSSGKYSAFCALRTFIAKPRLLPIVFRLAVNSQKASQSLCSFVESFLEALQ
jgi:nucleoside phosphorylase